MGPKEVVCRLFSRWHDVHLMAEDMENTLAPDAVFEQVTVTRTEGVADISQGWWYVNCGENAKVTILSISQADDDTVMVERLHEFPNATNHIVSRTTVSMFKFEGDKIVLWHDFEPRETVYREDVAEVTLNPSDYHDFDAEEPVVNGASAEDTVQDHNGRNFDLSDRPA